MLRKNKARNTRQNKLDDVDDEEVNPRTRKELYAELERLNKHYDDVMESLHDIGYILPEAPSRVIAPPFNKFTLAERVRVQAEIHTLYAQLSIIVQLHIDASELQVKFDLTLEENNDLKQIAEKLISGECELPPDRRAQIESNFRSQMKANVTFVGQKMICEREGDYLYVRRYHTETAINQKSAESAPQKRNTGASHSQSDERDQRQASGNPITTKNKAKTKSATGSNQTEEKPVTRAELDETIRSVNRIHDNITNFCKRIGLALSNFPSKIEPPTEKDLSQDEINRLKGLADTLSVELQLGEKYYASLRIAIIRYDLRTDNNAELKIMAPGWVSGESEVDSEFLEDIDAKLRPLLDPGAGFVGTRPALDIEGDSLVARRYYLLPNVSPALNNAKPEQAKQSPVILNKPAKPQAVQAQPTAKKNNRSKKKVPQITPQTAASATAQAVDAKPAANGNKATQVNKEIDELNDEIARTQANSVARAERLKRLLNEHAQKVKETYYDDSNHHILGDRSSYKIDNYDDVTIALTELVIMTPVEQLDDKNVNDEEAMNKKEKEIKKKKEEFDKYKKRFNDSFDAIDKLLGEKKVLLAEKVQQMTKEERRRKLTLALQRNQSNDDDDGNPADASNSTPVSEYSAQKSSNDGDYSPAGAASNTPEIELSVNSSENDDVDSEAGDDPSEDAEPAAQATSSTSSILYSKKQEQSTTRFIQHQLNKNDGNVNTKKKRIRRKRQNKNTNNWPLNPSALPLSNKNVQVIIATIDEKYAEYTRHCKLMDKSGVFDATSAVLIAEIEGSLLSFYDILAAADTTCPEQSLFKDASLSALCRNFAKYCYPEFLFRNINDNGRNISMADQFIQFTLGAVRKSLNAFMYPSRYLNSSNILMYANKAAADFRVSAEDTSADRLRNLLKEYTSESVDMAAYEARYYSVIEIIQSINNESTKQAYGLSKDKLARALLFSLALMGLLIKTVLRNNQAILTLLPNYSSYTKAIIMPGKDEEPISLEQAEDMRYRPLLSYLEGIITHKDGHKMAETVLSNLPATDMMRLLIEICNTKSHVHQQKWVAMTPVSREVIWLTAKALLKIQSQVLAECIERMQAVSASRLLDQLRKPDYQQVLRRTNANLDPFYRDLESALKAIAIRDRSHGLAGANQLLLSIDDKCQFARFTNKYLWMPGSAKLIDEARFLLERVTGAQRLINCHVRTMRV